MRNKAFRRFKNRIKKINLDILRKMKYGNIVRDKKSKIDLEEQLYEIQRDYRYTRL